MITIISPTTTMNFDKNIKINNSSNPFFIEEVNYLMNILRTLSTNEISDLMNLSNDLANLNYNRYSTFGNESNPTCQSILAFDGEVFNCMDVSKFDNTDIKYANEHLRILSGLYGVLRPFDIIEPYRLEMKAKLNNKYGKDLYKFWKSKITDYIINELDSQSNSTLINLASSEYLKCIDLKLIKEKYKFVDVAFKEYNSDKNTYVVKGLYAKKARGYMVSYIIKNKIDDIEGLKNFNTEGYSFNPDLSNDETFVFTR
ncbi:MAG: peroxide stress protein YaaA [Peptostreptococcaceae bacterium]